jgi:hypothetical protein
LKKELVWPNLGIISNVSKVLEEDINLLALSLLSQGLPCGHIIRVSQTREEYFKNEAYLKTAGFVAR